MIAEQATTVEVFISFDHEDEPLLRELEKQLRFLERQGHISAWHDYAVQAGQECVEEIDKHLHSAHVILLLISPAFIASDKCYQIEMKQAMKKHEAGEALVIPIILRQSIGRTNHSVSSKYSPLEGNQ